MLAKAIGCAVKLLVSQDIKIRNGTANHLKNCTFVEFYKRETAVSYYGKIFIFKCRVNSLFC